MHFKRPLGLLLWGVVSVVCQALSAAPALQRPDAIGIELGRSIDYQVVATGASKFSASGLPAGVTIDAKSGRIQGTPTEIGTYPVTVSASNGEGTSTMTLGISVVAPDAAPLIYAPLTFDAFNLPEPGGDRFTVSLKATGSPTRYEITDTLPSGWTFTAGTLVGVSTAPGLYMVPVSATNGFGVGSAAVTVRVHAACTEISQTTGALKAGDVFRVTLTFNRALTFSDAAPYLEFHSYPSGATRRVAYVSGNGTNTWTFEYVIPADEPAGDILLYKSIQPSKDGEVVGTADESGLNVGASLPIMGPYVPVASVAAAATPATPTPADTGTPAETPPAPPTSAPATGSDPGVTPPAETPVVTTPPAPTTPQGGTGGSGTDNGSATPTPPTPPTTEPASPTGPVAPAASARRARLVNLSARAAVTEGGSGASFITGFVVSGNTPKAMLVRAVGPTLKALGVESVLPNPRLRIFDSKGEVLAESDDWSGATLAATAARLGAFALDAGSRDAALSITLAPGSYTMQVVPGSGNGVALAEVYDAEPDAGGTLVNVSARGAVREGEGVLTAGFVVNGSSPKRLLVRGVGPALTELGVSGVLVDPVLKIYKGSNVVASNDDWQEGGASDAARAGAQATGAFGLGAGSRDAATVVTLEPGPYTAVVSGKSGGTGAALVEVYELPED